VIVLDASAVLDLLLNLPPHAAAIHKRLSEESPELLTLHLLDAEVGQVLRRHVRRRELSAARAKVALEDLAALPLQRYPLLPLLMRAFELRENATVYDALYLALAESARAPLITRDARLAEVPGHSADVEVVA
jgi:predicted nucleic acid-binding protein